MVVAVLCIIYGVVCVVVVTEFCHCVVSCICQDGRHTLLSILLVCVVVYVVWLYYLSFVWLYSFLFVWISCLCGLLLCGYEPCGD